MANAPRPSRYAPPSDMDRAERLALAELAFVGPAQKAFCLSPSNPIQKVRDELHRVYAAQMGALDARIMAGPQPAMAAAPRVASFAAPDAHAVEARAEQQDEIARAMGSGKYAPDAPRTTSFDPRTGVQTFGVGAAR